MTTNDTTATGAGLNPRARRMAALSVRVDEALAGSTQATDASKASVRRVMDGFLADPSSFDRDFLLAMLGAAVGQEAALDALRMKPPRPGLVWCCSTLGWVMPRVKFDHVWDTYSGID